MINIYKDFYYLKIKQNKIKEFIDVIDNLFLIENQKKTDGIVY